MAKAPAAKAANPFAKKMPAGGKAAPMAAKKGPTGKAAPAGKGSYGKAGRGMVAPPARKAK